MQPTPIEHCMGGEGTVLMEKLLDAPAEMLGKGRAYVRHTIRPGVSIGSHTHEHEMETMVVVSGRARHVINGEEQLLEAGDIIGAMPGDRSNVWGTSPWWSSHRYSTSEGRGRNLQDGEIKKQYSGFIFTG